jgi:purine-nucleoside phosphorylase
MPAINKKLSRTLDFLGSRIRLKPETGIILGSGFGDIANLVKEKQLIPYQKIAHFPVSTVRGHKGNLITGKIGKRNVIIMQGRAHYYEGYSMSEVAFLVRVMAGLGIKKLIVTTSVGGIKEGFNKGDLMIIKDHINLIGENPLRGEKKDPFIDMSSAYDKRFQGIAVRTGKKSGLKMHKGILAALPGPSYETPAEINMLKRLGADAVCMSTVPEVIMARYLGLKVLGIALISNMAAGISPKPLSHADVVQAGKEKMKEAAALIEYIVKKI